MRKLLPYLRRSDNSILGLWPLLSKSCFDCFCSHTKLTISVNRLSSFRISFVDCRVMATIPVNVSFYYEVDFEYYVKW